MKKKYDIDSSVTNINNVEEIENSKEPVIVKSLKVVVNGSEKPEKADDNLGEENNVKAEHCVIQRNLDNDVVPEHIVNEVGSVRGVKNQVRDRIRMFAAGEFLPPHEELPNDSEEILSDDLALLSINNTKVIIYTTSLGLIRKTRADCLSVMKKFRNLMVKTEERDIVIQKYRKEYEEQFSGLSPPQVLANDQHLGGAAEIEELVESGGIKEIIKDIPKIDYVAEPCSNCAGHGFTNCPKCLGSGRSRITRVGASRELIYLKCSFCDEGLIRCTNCLDYIH